MLGMRGRIQEAWWNRGVWEGVPSPLKEGLERCLPPAQKKMNYSLEMACFGEFWAVFLSVSLPEKCWIFRLKWWFGGRWRCTFGTWWSQSHGVGKLFTALQCKQSGAWIFENWQNLRAICMASLHSKSSRPSMIHVRAWAWPEECSVGYSTPFLGLILSKIW